MICKLTATAAVLAFCWVCTLPALGEPAAAPSRLDPVQLEAYVDGFLEARIREHDIVGATLAIVQAGQPILLKGYGYDDKEAGRAVDPARSLFRPGSISKTFTWTAVMQLHEQGRLDLEADIRDYLPNVEIDSAFDRPITMLDLMAHQPGFEDYALGHLFEFRPEDVLPLETYLNTRVPVQVRAPGTLPAYSNYGSGLAGQIVANLSDMSFEDYIDTHVTGPLGMRQSTFREPLGADRAGSMPPHMAANVSKGYRKAGADHVATDFVYVGHLAPAGAMSVTAADMAVWMLTHLGDGAHAGNRILEPATAERMHTQHRANHPQLPGMAHGFIESTHHGYRGYGHGGGTVHFLSTMVMIPALDLGVFLSTNTTTGGRLTSDFVTSILAQFYPVGPQRLAASATASADTTAYVGDYVLTRRSYTRLEKLNIPAVTISPGESGTLTTSAGGQSRLFESVSEHLFRGVADPDQLLAFDRGGDGRISRFFLSLPIFAAERAGLLDRTQPVVNLLVAAVITFCGVLIGAWLRRRRSVAQSVMQMWAARTVYATALAWLVGLGLLTAEFVSITGEPNRAFQGFPGPMIYAGLVICLLSVVLSIAAVALLRPVWADGTWPVSRRLRHTGVVILALAVSILAYYYNAIGFHF